MKSKLPFSFLLISFLLISSIIKAKEIPLTEFNTIMAGATFEITLERAEKNHLIIEGQEDIAPYVVATVSQKCLKLSLSDDYYRLNKKSHKPIKVKLMATQVTRIELSGVAHLYSKSTFTSEDFAIILNDASTLACLTVDLSNLSVECKGASSLTLEGRVKSASYVSKGATKLSINHSIDSLYLKAEGVSKVYLNSKSIKQEIYLSGATYVESTAFPAKEVYLDISGRASAKIFVSESLGVRAKENSSLYYKGEPSIKLLEISELSTLKKIN